MMLCEWGPHDEISATVRRGRDIQSFSMCTYIRERPCEHTWGSDCLNPEWGSCQNLTMPALILDFQNFEKINVLFKPASLWYLVMAAWANQDEPYYWTCGNELFSSDKLQTLYNRMNAISLGSIVSCGYALPMYSHNLYFKWDNLQFEESPAHTLGLKSFCSFIPGNRN